MGPEVSIFWFRRDLRLNDNAGLFHALNSGYDVLPIFIFDENILEKLNNKSDTRVQFIHQNLEDLNQKLNAEGSNLISFYGKPLDIFKKLIKNYTVREVYTNTDYEPYATKRDKEVSEFLKLNQIEFISTKDQVIFEKDEIIKDDGKPYTVFTPYSRKWLNTLLYSRLNDNKEANKYLKHYPSESLYSKFYKQDKCKILTLHEIGFNASDITIPELVINEDLISKYSEMRDFPGIKGTSRLGIHLRFGTISIRKLMSIALEINSTFLNELIWREFYAQILWHFPANQFHAFKAAYDNIEWRNNEDEFLKWCSGNTGYPFVDAGMRELNNTGFMHNRARMITASFLTKHLLIDWRWGEAYFAEKLLDYDLASNNGGWQWSAGCGTDAAPYFRIFNPEVQLKKFDPNLDYVKKWIPEYGTTKYATKIVDHNYARDRCLKTYKEALNKEGLH